ncbi:MAG: T9SS C-terminal target domain-containing protein [Thermosipho sp. (in: Bacteria)]|nr:T9SS C-terminal target domain-containing protein [Thermosipho sp. (in: thermotogales)]
MKKIIFILIILGLLLLSCVPSNTPPSNNETNNLPTQPSNPSPSDGATDVSLTPSISWEASDPDGDSLTFDIYFGTESTPTLVKSDLATNTYTPDVLNSFTTYYWKIVAKDGKSGVVEGPLWNFTTGVIAWQKTLGGSNGDEAYSIQQTSDGGYIVAGTTYSNNGDVSGNHGGRDFWIVKLDDDGNIKWQKALGGSNNELAYSIQQTSDGGYIVAGNTNSNDGDVSGNHGNFDYWVIKLDNSGNIEWQKALGGSDYEYARSIQQTNDGGYIVAGTAYSNDGDVTGNNVGNCYWVVKLDSNGNIEWQKALGGSSGDWADSIQQTSDGGYIVAGYTYSNDGDVSGNHGERDFWIVKLDKNGNIEWQKALGGSSGDWAHSIRQTSDGGYIVAGYTYSNDGDVSGNHGERDFWIVKLDNNGNIVWQKTLGGSQWDEAYSVQQTSDRGYIVAGITWSNDGDVSGNHGGDDYWVVKLDTNGNIVWQKTLGGSRYETASSIQQTSDGGYIVAGYTDSNDGYVSGNHGSRDYWVVKLGK